MRLPLEVALSTIVQQSHKQAGMRPGSPWGPSDWVWLFLGCLLSVEIANLVLLGWHHGLYPVLTKPYLYAGDALYYQAMFQRAIEGWALNSPRMGFPFGSAWHDFPNYDDGNLLVIKMLGKITGSGVAATNLYFLLGFAAIFAASFSVIRWLGVKRPVAACFAIIFTFAPYHFARYFYGHIPYTWYFCVPIVFYCGYKIFEEGDIFSNGWRDLLKYLPISVLLSIFGTYFAFFCAILLMLCGIAGSIKTRRIRPFIAATLLCAMVTVGVVVNLAPAIAYRHEHGANPEAATRSPEQTEYYSLKIIHLLLPQQFSRSQSLAKFANSYDANFPLSNTNSSVGLVGVVGFFVTLLVGLAIAVGRNIDARLRFATTMVLATLLICTVGGLNDLVAIFVTPLIRGWDRFAIFVNFGVLLVLAVLFDRYVAFKFIGGKSRYAVIGASAVLAIFAIIEQTPSSYRFLIDGAFARYDADAAFIGEIEAVLPKGAAIYQLPYISFPESADLNRMSAYDQLVGFLNSKDLKWSFGGIKGRDGDIFYRSMSEKSPAEQIEMARKMGFAGIYIDRLGYADGGASITEAFRNALGEQPMMKADGSVAFFKLAR